ncbi:MAG: ABC transporter permease [Phycisphaeraceae bacterium]|nr:ABC transporter permease [Phycisphaeraceae bacterium]
MNSTPENHSPPPEGNRTGATQHGLGATQQFRGPEECCVPHTPPAPQVPPESLSSAELSSHHHPLLSLLDRMGRPVNEGLRYVGGLVWLLLDTCRWIWRSLFTRQVRFGRFAFYAQLVRIGVRSVGVVALVCGCIGFILALQMAPPLEPFGQLEQVPVIIGIAVFRELGPLISAIVLTGFAGASIAAELGTMVVGEEIEALHAHALNPIRFLVMPRVLATVLSLIVLCVIGELIAVASGWAVGVAILDVPSKVYLQNTIDALDMADFFTGLFKAGVFGMLIGLVACYNGLSVTGGAAGVGKATTNTVVFSIVGTIVLDLIFTSVFFRLGWT